MTLLHTSPPPPYPLNLCAHLSVAVNLAKLKLFRHYYIMVGALFSLREVSGGVFVFVFCRGVRTTSPLVYPL